MLDFNDTPSSQAVAVCPDLEREEVRAALLDRLEPILLALLPAAKIRAGKLIVGDVLGSPGRSLEFELEGERRGLWIDRSAQTGGDVYDFLAQHRGLDVRQQFAQVLVFARELLGRPEVMTASPVSVARASSKPKKTAALDDLGPATAKWDYHDAQGHLIACVYRYDPMGEDGVRRKEFRPWDAKRRKAAPPEPRPLYNQPGLLAADTVVLVEGEKCAQALIDAGICATTAMHGANAPVGKTDWSPLRGKAVLIWPDKDKAGWAYAQAASQALLAAGATSCAILLPADEHPESWDAADALREQFDVHGFVAGGPRIKIHAADDAPPQAPNHSVLGSGDALALSFAQQYQDDWRFVSAWGQWMMWDGQRWRADNTLAAGDLVRHICRHAALQADNRREALSLASSGMVSGVERLTKLDRRNAGSTDEWDVDPWVINTPGGMVDLRTGQLRPHDRRARMTKVTTATLRDSPSSDSCPHWLRFLAQATGGDQAQIDYLQRVFGYCLTGSTEEHALFFLYGTGANGKSVFVNTLFTLLGDYAANAPMDTFMESRSDRHPTDLAGLRGARFVAATETEQGRRWNESKIKEITGGDRVSARFMRQDFFTYTPQFKLVIAGNHKPAIRNIDEAMRRRLHLIPFTITVPPHERDKHLADKLLTERDGIFSWGVQGCLNWQKQGISPPQCVLDATDEYFESEDALGRWLDERCVLTPGAHSLTTELFNDWKLWAEGAGEFVGTQRRFSDLLLNRGLSKWRNSAGIRGYQGIGLKQPPTPGYAPYADG